MLLTSPVLKARLNKAAARATSTSSVSELVEYVMSAVARRRDRARRAGSAVRGQGQPYRDALEHAHRYQHEEEDASIPQVDPSEEVWLHRYVLASICAFDGVEFVVLAVLLRVQCRHLYALVAR